VSTGLYYGHDQWIKRSFVTGKRFNVIQSRPLTRTEVHIINHRLCDKTDLDVYLIQEVETLYDIFKKEGRREVSEYSGVIRWYQYVVPTEGRPNDEYVE
jgi:hypothetical protein